MQLTEIFEELRAPGFLKNQRALRALVARHLASNNMALNDLIETIQGLKVTGKNEVSAKLAFLAGGEGACRVTPGALDASRQLGSEYNLSTNTEVQELWKEVLGVVRVRVNKVRAAA